LYQSSENDHWQLTACPSVKTEGIQRQRKPFGRWLWSQKCSRTKEEEENM